MTGETHDATPPVADEPRPQAQEIREAALETAPAAAEKPVSYDGKAGRLLGLGSRIALLSLLTLGFYRFWGKTEVRRYLWSRVSLLSDRFEYTGTARELFLGFLIALTVLIPLGALSWMSEILLTGSSAVTRGVVSGVQYTVLLFLIGYATYRARRYRLSRTILRGIRFWQTGSNVGYALRWMGYLVLSIVTLGLAKPVGDAALHRYVMRHTWFGSQAFAFEGRAGPMFGRWLLCLLLLPFTLGLSLLWYAAFRTRYLVGQTRYEEIRLSLPVTFGNLFRIYLPYVIVLGALSCLFYWYVFALIDPAMIQNLPQDEAELWSDANFLIVYATTTVTALIVFGLVAPVLQLVLITHRMIGLVAGRLGFEGEVDLSRVMQSAAEQPKRGEGLADALDVGGGLEIGL